MEKKGTIEFGHANEQNPVGSWEGITFGDANHISKADYYGAVESDGHTYIITKIIEAWNKDVEGKFFVVDATAKIYDDGSGNIFADQEQSDKAKEIQDGFNIDMYVNIEDLLKDERMACVENKEFQELMETNLQSDIGCIATAIKHEEFCKMLQDKVVEEIMEFQKIEEPESQEIRSNNYENTIPQPERIRPREKSFKDEIDWVLEKNEEELQAISDPKKDLWMSRFSNWYDSIDRLSNNIKKKFTKMKSDIIKVIKDKIKEKNIKQENNRKEEENER